MKSRLNSLERQFSESTFTLQVYECIKEVCAPEEIDGVQMEKEFPTPGRHIRVDFLIENGLKKLDWPKNTIIEIKTYLDARTLKFAYNLYQHLSQQKKSVNKFVIIYYKSIYSFIPDAKELDKNIQILSFEELQSLCLGNNFADNKTQELENSHISINNVNKTWEETRETKIEDLKKYMEEDCSTLFLGAGVSASANMPSWGKLLEQLLTQHSTTNSPDYFPCDLANVLHCCGESYLIAARYINYIINKETRAKIIQKALYENTQESDLIESLCKLIKEKNVSQIITTNYDQLVEQGLKKEGLNPYPIAQSGIMPKNTIPVYHVHGSVNDPQNPIINDLPEAPVLSEEDYHTLYSTGHHWSNTAILHALQHTHCIFIGLSMTDPNLRRLIESAYYEDAPHYVFLPRTPLYEGYYKDDKRNMFHFDVQEKIMGSLGINVIWYAIKNDSSNPHEELATLIQRLYALDP